MYLLFRYKNILPSVSYNLEHGEFVITKAFMEFEIESKNKAVEELNNSFDN